MARNPAWVRIDDGDLERQFTRNCYRCSISVWSRDDFYRSEPELVYGQARMPGKFLVTELGDLAKVQGFGQKLKGQARFSSKEKYRAVVLVCLDQDCEFWDGDERERGRSRTVS